MKTKNQRLAALVSLLTVAFMLFSGFAVAQKANITLSNSMLETTSITEGNVCNINGTVEFARGMKSVKVTTYDSNWNRIDEVEEWKKNPVRKSQIYYLVDSPINANICFERYTPGNYILRVEAVDTIGAMYTKDYSFSIISRAPVVTYTNTDSYAYRFIRSMYAACLYRNASDAEIRSWSDRLQCGQIDAATVAVGFFESNEFISKHLSNEDFVLRLYRALLHREPDAGGYNSWLTNLRNGMSRHTVIQYFVASEEFSQICRRYHINKGRVY